MRILHLTDLHFGNNHYFRQKNQKDNSKLSLSESIHHCLSKNNLQSIDFIIISGDIFDLDIEKEMIQAKFEIRELIKKFNLSSENLLVVPGNHDIDWSDKFDNDKYYPFKSLIEDIYKDGGTFEFPTFNYLNNDIVIIGLNSCTYENKLNAGLGRIGENQLRLLEKEFERNEKLKKARFKLAVLHHHLLPVNNESQNSDPGNENNKSKLSVTLDSVNVLRILSELGVGLVVSGHQHQNSIIEYENIYDKNNSIIVLSLASTGLKTSDQAKYRAFNVYSLNNDNCDIITFKEKETEPNYFSHNSDIKIKIPYSRSKSSYNNKNELCNFIFNYRKIDSRFHSPYINDDFSDLYIIFLSVVDCSISRALIKQALMTITKDHKLRAFYDLLGKYDLAVFISIKDSSDFKEIFIDKIKESLINGGMMLTGEEFSEIKYINVSREAGKFDKFLDTGDKTYFKRLLGNTEDYEKNRIQKGLIFIEFQETTKVSIETIIIQISEIVKKNSYEEFIESVYQGNFPKKTIIIEFFTKCSEYFLINKFNRDIEQCLTKALLQKNTMLYYYYEEFLEESD